MGSKKNERYGSVPIVRICDKDGNVLDGHLLRPGDHLNIAIPKGAVKLICDGVQVK